MHATSGRLSQCSTVGDPRVLEKDTDTMVLTRSTESAPRLHIQATTKATSNVQNDNALVVRGQKSPGADTC